MPGLFCLRCEYNLFATPTDAHCPECGFPADQSLAASMLPHHGAEHRASLKQGLVLLAVSLYAIPVIPLVITGLVFAGTDLPGLSVLFALMVSAEHVFWAMGVGCVCSFAARPEAAKAQQRQAQRARAAAWLCAGFAVATVLVLAVLSNATIDSGWGPVVVLTAMTLLTLAARAVSLLDGSRSAGRGLKALRCGGAGTMLRGAAIFGVLASGSVGLGSLGVGALGWSTGAPRLLGFLAWLVALGTPAIWLSGLIGGTICTVAAVQVNRRLRETDAVLRHAPREPDATTSG